MWCAYEKLCKLCPSKLDPNKIFSDLNPKILIFKKNIQNGTNTNNLNPLQINNPNVQLPSSNHPKDFSLSPDNVNNLNNKFNSIENKCVNTSHREKHSTVNRFNLINNNEDSVWREGNSNNVNNLNMNNFNSNSSGYCMNPSNNPNMTPVVNKDKIDEYPSLNYNQPPVKNRDNLKPFLFSSSPQGMQLEFGGNAINTSSNNNFTNSSNDLRQKYGDSVIKPFNITQGSGLVYNNEFTVTPNNIRNLLNSNKSNEENLSNNKLTNNIFNNIHLNENKQSGNIQVQQGQQSLKELSNQNQSQKFTDITQLLKIFGEIAKAFHLFNCEDALNLIKSLPFIHQKSSWSLVTLGRCYFEVAKYKECDKIFRECLRLDPARLEGMEYYSSCLWHLKDQYQLVNLASHVLEQSHFCAETWIVVGNCYSLQKEHELALKFFNRAIQINPNFAYAYTLCGHEYVENESFAQAKQCYSHAISCDDR
jgi:tetratricopeptide (TPR) repeat protein